MSEKPTQRSITKSLDRMSCGRGLCFINNVPFVDDVFPILKSDNPKSIIGLVNISVRPNEFREAECHITYLHTAPMKGMVENTEYKKSPVTHIPEPANFINGVTPVKIKKHIHSIFQDMVMGGQYLFGYPLAKNKLDYLDDPKEYIETYLDDMVSGLALHIHDYYESGIDITPETDSYLDQMIDVLNEVELENFTFDILVPKGMLMGISHDYCVTPRSSISKPFTNPHYDQYVSDIPTEIEKIFQTAILNARQKYGLEVQAVLDPKQKQFIKKTL